MQKERTMDDEDDDKDKDDKDDKDRGTIGSGKGTIAMSGDNSRCSVSSSRDGSLGREERRSSIVKSDGTDKDGIG